MFADVELTLAERDVLLVSRDAIIRQEGTGVFYVYVVDGGVARRHEVALGQGFGAGIEVLSGLSAGDDVVTAGRYRLRDGAAVRIRDSVRRGPGTAAAGEERDR